ncbi:MAG TPA: hypothetical protein VFA07_16035 [Chthonomonadaceae bacterium]|nr:hypothetical protein [Chthonomonadaceae bacterium]
MSTDNEACVTPNETRIFSYVRDHIRLCDTCRQAVEEPERMVQAWESVSELIRQQDPSLLRKVELAAQDDLRAREKRHHKGQVSGGERVPAHTGGLNVGREREQQRFVFGLKWPLQLAAVTVLLLVAFGIGWAITQRPATHLQLFLPPMIGQATPGERVVIRYRGWDSLTGKKQENEFRFTASAGQKSFSVPSLDPGELAIQLRVRNRVFARTVAIVQGNTPAQFKNQEENEDKPAVHFGNEDEPADFDQLSAMVLGAHSLPMGAELQRQIGTVYYDNLRVAVERPNAKDRVVSSNFDEGLLPEAFYVHWRGAASTISSDTHAPGSGPYSWREDFWPNTNTSIATDLSEQEIQPGEKVSISASVFIVDPRRGAEVGVSHFWTDEGGGGEQAVMAAITLNNGVIRPCVPASVVNDYPPEPFKAQRWHNVQLLLVPSARRYQASIDGQPLWGGAWLPMVDTDKFHYQFTNVYWSGTNFVHEEDDKTSDEPH